MRMDKLTSRFQQALSDAQSLAVGRDHNLIEPAHLMVALLDQSGGSTRPMLAQAGVNVTLLRQRLGEKPVLGLSVRQGELSLTPRVPAHWPSFGITLRLDGRVVTLRWQRADVALEEGFKPDRVLAPGEVVRLADLPMQASLLVQATA